MTLLSKIGNANVQTNDFNLKQWQSEVQKGQFQYNMLPQAEINGQFFTQRMAILKYVATQCGLYPTNSAEESLKVDEVTELCSDTLEVMARFHPSLSHMCCPHGKEGQEIEKTSSLKKGVSSEHVTDCVNNRLQLLDKIYGNRGSNGFANGKSLTVADIVTFCVCRLVESGICEGISSDCVNQCKNVVQCKKNVEDKIKSTGVKLSSPRISVTREAVIAG